MAAISIKSPNWTDVLVAYRDAIEYYYDLIF